MSMSNQPGTPRDDSEMGGNFLNPFQSESVSISLPGLLDYKGEPICISGLLFRKRKICKFCSVLVVQHCALHVS